ADAGRNGGRRALTNTRRETGRQSRLAGRAGNRPGDPGALLARTAIPGGRLRSARSLGGQECRVCTFETALLGRLACTPTGIWNGTDRPRQDQAHDGRARQPARDSSDDHDSAYLTAAVSTSQPDDSVRTMMCARLCGRLTARVFVVAAVGV